MVEEKLNHLSKAQVHRFGCSIASEENFYLLLSEKCSILSSVNWHRVGRRGRELAAM